jgi:hypothetical protein
MGIGMILKIIAALATAATGLLAFVKPTATYGFIGLNANGARGVSEIRAIFGGLFIALGVAPFFLGAAALAIWPLPWRARFRLCSTNHTRNRISSAWALKLCSAQFSLFSGVCHVGSDCYR